MSRKPRPTWFVLAAASFAILLIGAPSVPGQNDPAVSEEAETIVPFALPKSGPFNPADIEIKNDQSITDWFRSAHNFPIQPTNPS